MHPYSSNDTRAAWKKLHFILSVRSDFHSISIAVHAFSSCVWTPILSLCRFFIFILIITFPLWTELFPFWTELYPFWTELLPFWTGKGIDDKFTYRRSSVSSTWTDINTQLEKAWTAIDMLWKSDLTDKMKCNFFQAALVSILLYGCTTWTLTKRREKRLDDNYTRMLRAILNQSWRQHPTKQQLYGHLPSITKPIQVRQTRHAGHCWRSNDEFIRQDD